MSIFGNKEVGDSNKSAIKFAIEYGEKFKSSYGEEIKKRFLAGQGPVQIVEELELRKSYPLIADKTLENAVSRALSGYDGASKFSTTQAYDGLLSEQSYGDMQAQQHSGRSTASAIERWSNDPQRWSPDEIAAARSLVNDPFYHKPKSLFHKQSPDYDTIAGVINAQFHGGAPMRSGTSVKVALSRHK